MVVTMAKTMLRGCPEAIDSTCQSKCCDPRSRETKYICSLCLSNAILVPADPVRAIGATTETATINRCRAPSGPVKVTVTQPHARPHEVSTSLVGSQHSWRGCKIAPCFAPQGGAPQYPQEVVIPCPTRERSGLQRDLQDAPGSPVF